MHDHIVCGVLDVCTLCEVADVCSTHLAVMEDSLHCLISSLRLGIASPVWPACEVR